MTIEIISEEKYPNEWSEDISSDLFDIFELNQATNLRFIHLRRRCVWNSDTKKFESSAEFLGLDREPIAAVKHRNLERFSKYLPVFYLDPLRDAGNEFSTRSSQFWKPLLKHMNFPQEMEEKVDEFFDELNTELLEADHRLNEIANTLSETTKIATRDSEGSLELRMTPLKTWDLISRAEIILKNEENQPLLPLRNQGQGIQSLLIIFLFQAFIEHLLGEYYEKDSVPVLALEEPETHLHPQAVRTLYHHVDKLSGQKIITTHSPYLVQNLPLRDLRIIRFIDGETKIFSLPSKYSVSLPNLVGLDTIVRNSSVKLSYDDASELLIVYGKLDTPTKRDLMKLCGNNENRQELINKLKDLELRSSMYMEDQELDELRTYAQRIRGELFFAQRWLLVEGQSDYILVHSIANALGYDLDQHGVTVIDVQNNGNPAIFAALAHALEIPWLAEFDNDDQGRKFIESIKKRGIPESEVDWRCSLHKAGDLEDHLVKDGLDQKLRETLETIGEKGNISERDELLKKLKENKVPYARELAKQIQIDPKIAKDKISAFKDTINKLRVLN